MISRYFITRVSLDFNDRMITKCRLFAERIVLNVELGYDDDYKELIKRLCQRIEDRKIND